MPDEFEKYRRAAKEGILEIGKLFDQEKQIKDKINKLHRLIVANIQLLPDEEREEIFAALETDMTSRTAGLSESVLSVIPVGEFLSAVEVRDALIKAGYDFSNQSNALASVHTTLKRLFTQGKLSMNGQGEQMKFAKVEEYPAMNSGAFFVRLNEANKGKSGTGIIDRDVVRKALLQTDEILKKNK